MRLPVTTALAVALVALPACGQLKDDASGDDQNSSNGSAGAPGSASDGCVEQQLRLSVQTCSTGGRVVEKCAGGNWQGTSDCRKPDDCVEGDTQVLPGYCGKRPLNAKVTICSGEVLQDGCLCGTVNPVDLGYDFAIHSQLDASALAGITYIEALDAGMSAGDQPLVIPGNLLCALSLGLGPTFPPAFPDLVAAGGLGIAGVVPSLPKLRLVERLVVTGKADLSGLTALETVTQLIVLDGTLEHVVGARPLVSLEYAEIEGDVVSLELLSLLTEMGGFLTITSQSPDLDLTGLSELTHIGGDLTLFIPNADGLAALAKLDRIDGDVTLTTPSGDAGLACAVGAAFAKKTVGGTLLINRDLYRPERC
jgi:hypothetical protein